MEGCVVVERWTPDRRREHTRNLLLDAAAEVFARRGFEGASLEEIAQAAGFTRGAIYNNFDGKEDLFLAVNERFNEQAIAAFSEMLAAAGEKGLDLEQIAVSWQDLTERESLALALEFDLYVLRNPDVGPRVAESRRRNRKMIADFIDKYRAATGTDLDMSSDKLAQVIAASADGLRLAAELDGDSDLYASFLKLITRAVTD
jgi:AcrR family transcriptional regulator